MVKNHQKLIDRSQPVRTSCTHSSSFFGYNISFFDHISIRLFIFIPKFLFISHFSPSFCLSFPFPCLLACLHDVCNEMQIATMCYKRIQFFPFDHSDRCLLQLFALLRKYSDSILFLSHKKRHLKAPLCTRWSIAIYHVINFFGVNQKVIARVSQFLISKIFNIKNVNGN